jgi:hypothetical protein
VFQGLDCHILGDYTSMTEVHWAPLHISFIL